MQEVGNDEEFTLPFWDWTGNPNQCDPAICSKELLGVTDQTTGTVKGDYFNDWYVLCTRKQTDSLTKPCDPTDKRYDLKRNTDDEKEKKEKEQGYDMTFTKKTEVNFALRFETFDLPPYNKESSCNFEKHPRGLCQHQIWLSPS